MIRSAAPADAADVARIYDHYVATSIATFEEREVGAEAMAGRIAAVQTAGLPWLVAEEEGRIVGYAYASPWHARSAYRHSVEITVYLDPALAGAGRGSALYERLFAELGERDVHAVLAAIALPNPASIALHEKYGLTKAGHLSEVGLKFGEWIDVGYWEATLARAGLR